MAVENKVDLNIESNLHSGQQTIPKPSPIGVGMPELLLLHQFGRIIIETFGKAPVLVGSALEKKERVRDIDVRLVLSREEFEQVCGPVETLGVAFTPWYGFSLAFSVLGQRMTGLPIDFQITFEQEGNRHLAKPRMALGI